MIRSWGRFYMAPTQEGDESIRGTVRRSLWVGCTQKAIIMRLMRQEGARSGGPVGRPMEDVFTPGYGKPSRTDVTCHMFVKAHSLGTSLVVQWLGLSNPNAGSLGSIPGQGTSSHMQ